MYTASIEVHKLKAQSAKIVFGVLAVLGVLVGISSEKAARNMQNIMEDYSDANIPEAFKNLEDMTPEEAGAKMGEFLKGLEQSIEEDKK